MIKAITLNLKNVKPHMNDFAKALSNNWRLLLMTALFCCGLVTGTSLIMRYGDGMGAYVKTLIEKLFMQKLSRDFLVLAGEGLLLNLLVFVSGLCAVGLPLILLSPCIQGIIIGSVCSYLYTVYQIDGVIFSLVIIVPFCAVSVLMLLIGCNEAIIMSSGIIKAVLKSGENGRGEVKAYLIRGIIIAIVTSISTLLQSICIVGFGEKLLIR